MIKLAVSFKGVIKDYILAHGLYEPTKQTKYTLDQILDVIEYVLITGSSWRSLDLPIFKSAGFKWRSIYYHFQKFSDNHVFENVYKNLLHTYFKVNKSGKLKYLSVDSSFIKNEYASNVGVNGFYKKKRLSKLSLVTDSNVVPISAILAKGNYADQTLFYKNISNMMIQIRQVKKNNKHKRYILADAAYDTNEIRSTISSLNIHPIIWHVKRNRKDKTKNKKFCKKETMIYNRCIIIENCFSWLYKNRRINRRYDKLNATYKSFMYMAFIRLIIRKM